MCAEADRLVSEPAKASCRLYEMRSVSKADCSTYYVLQDDHRLRDMALWEDPEEGISDEAPVTGGRGDRGLKPIPEDAMRPSMDVSHKSGGALDGEVIEFMLVLHFLAIPSCSVM